METIRRSGRQESCFSQWVNNISGEVLTTQIREVLLHKIAAAGDHLQSGSILRAVSDELNLRNRDMQRALLTQFQELFRTGYLAWGTDLVNSGPPFFHITEQGLRTLAQLSRDPGNPDGYLRHIRSIADLSAISTSYLEEGVRCYVGAHYKACAVMVGAAAECLCLEMQATVVEKLKEDGRDPPSKLKEWRIKQILEGIKTFFDGQKTGFSEHLRNDFEGYWPAFTQQIRAARNDAGHPTNANPISPETAHASLLIFPEMAKLASQLRAWTVASPLI